LRVIALEEHYRAPAAKRDAGPTGPDRFANEAMANRIALLDDLGDGRLADMDAAGIDVQVLSHVGPAPNDLEPARAVPFAREVNDYLATAVARHPERFAGFATLPCADPNAAADELRRAVHELAFKGALINGHVAGRFLDHQHFWPIFEAAEELDVPIYLHPREPPAAVRVAYYSGLSEPAAEMLATAGWGWHVDTGMHALRLVLGGVFDRFPRLQIIIGHMGEALPFLLARASRNLTRAADLPQPLETYFAQNFYITTSGVFSYPPLLCLLAVLGSERVMFSVDFPYASNQEACRFLRDAPINASDRAKIAHGTAEHLLRL
jgi:predicted TIM-barrel fold metal-dependent hydrolase